MVAEFFILLGYCITFVYAGCPEAYALKDNNLCYGLRKAKMAFDDLNFDCFKDHDGDLATLDTEHKIKFLIEHIQDKDAYYINLQYTNFSGNVTFIPAAPPREITLKKGSLMDFGCVYIQKSNNQLEWYGTNCGARLSGICQSDYRRDCEMNHTLSVCTRHTGENPIRNVSLKIQRQMELKTDVCTTTWDKDRYAVVSMIDQHYDQCRWNISGQVEDKKCDETVVVEETCKSSITTPFFTSISSFTVFVLFLQFQNL